MKNLLVRLALVGGVAASVVTATGAFFSDTETAGNNTMTAGSLDVSVSVQNEPTTAFTNIPLEDNWAPGEEVLVNFDVNNTGTLPLNLRGAATGTWGEPGLDSQNMVKVTKVERWEGSGWDELVSNPAGITGLFYYSPDGTNTALFEVAPGAAAQFQLTVKFDEAAGNEFESKVFTTAVQVEAKQTNAPFSS